MDIIDNMTASEVIAALTEIGATYDEVHGCFLSAYKRLQVEDQELIAKKAIVYMETTKDASPENALECIGKLGMYKPPSLAHIFMKAGELRSRLGDDLPQGVL